MDRRTIIATAGAITLTVLAGSTAIAANMGILGDSPKAPVGQLSPVVNLQTTSTAETAEPARSRAATTSTLPPQVETVYVDEYLPGTAGSAGSSPVAEPVEAPPASSIDQEEADGGTTTTVTAYDDESEPADPSEAEDGSSDGSGDDEGDEADDEEYSGGEDDD